ncbi:MAG TPA: C2 family cysteine protease, partial [Pirellulales bacterium]|nr:C2 family cysteine protease [Pirellulales bacterium]
PSSAASYTVTAHDGSLSGAATVSVVASASGGLQNAFLSQLVQSLDADGSISRNDMIQILDSVSAKGAVTTSELADLKKIVSEATTLNMAGYVQVLASDVVNGNTANATYQGQALGNLAVGSSATQFNDLVGKWFLGTDLPTLTDSSLVYKTAAGSLFPTAPSHNNELQGELGDCYFISALGTIADKNPAAIENMFINNGDGTYTVRFYTGNYGSSYNSSDGSYSDGFTNGSGTADYVTVNLSLATTASGMLYYSDYGSSYSNANNALWIPLAEKAYAEWNQTGKEGRDGQNSFASIEGGWMATVDAQVLGHNATDYMMGTATQQQLVNALASGEAVTIGTTQTIYGLYGSHAYAVTGYNASSNTFTLYNPWGFDQPGQLTWAQLEASCSGFVAVNAAGSTAISGAPKVVVGATLKSEAISAASAASAGQDATAANDAWFASGASASVTDHASHDLAQQSGSDTVAKFAASNSAGSATSSSTTDEHLSGDHHSLETEAHSQLSSLAIKGLNGAAAADPWAIRA